MPGVAESFKSDIQKMTYTPDFNLVNLLHVENVNLTLDHLNSTIDMLENWMNIHLVSYDTLTSSQTIKQWPTLIRFLEFGIFDESYRSTIEHSAQWQIVMKVRVAFTLEVRAMPGFQSLSDWC